MKRIIKKTLLKTGKYFPQFFSNLVVKKFTDLNSHIFFGYYDTTPFDIKDEKILACRVPIKNHLKSIKMDLGYYYLDKANPKFIKFSETNAWCWQMGARLRWLNNQSDLVSFNTVYKNRYICKIQSINKTNEYESIPLPLYDINNDITYGLSLNFSRLQRLRPGYGYKNILDKSIKIKAPSNDGIILFDFKSKKEELLISLSKISKIEPDKSMKGATHYFNHISFSPNSRFFMFFHLWVNNNKRFSRLFIFDIETCKYKLISKNRVSHYTWKSDTELLITESKDGIVFYTLYNINDNSSKIFGKNILNNDGHPSFIDNNSIIFDSYPDIFGNQRLFIYDEIKQTKPKILYRSFAPPDFIGEKKCDLHPRLNKNNSLISIDTSSNGQREMHVIIL